MIFLNDMCVGLWKIEHVRLGCLPDQENLAKSQRWRIIWKKLTESWKNQGNF